MDASTSGKSGKSGGGADHVTVDVSEGTELEEVPSGGVSTVTTGNAPERQPGGSRTTKKDETLAEIQIQGLMWLEQPENKVFAKAHSTWVGQDLLFASRIDKKKKQSNSLRNEIYQVFGFYSVFQGVLLTAVAQSSYLHCHNWWSAFFLSLFASVVGIGGIIQKFVAILALEKTIKNEADTRQECINRVGRLLRLRQNFRFDLHAKDGKQKGNSFLNRLRYSVLVVFVCLILFSVLFLASIRQILCDPGRSKLVSP